MLKLILLELNEINFDHVAVYTERGDLPNFARLIAAHGRAETTSEDRYEDLEPWIQWVTAHTGLTLSEHGVFRLGDVLQRDVPQIWEMIEAQGVKTGAISPMNAVSRCVDAAFFVPDPWTPSTLIAPPLLKRLHAAISQAVNDNAQSRITWRSLFWLLTGTMRYARVVNYSAYNNMAWLARSKAWSKAMFLDLLLADVFITEARRTMPGFASLFLNAGAHIQHHYMFNSKAYKGDLKNPDWYVPPSADPVFELYELYDRIIGQIQSSFPHTRLMIATGLHQDPHPEVVFYWRLKDHAGFLRRHDVPFENVKPRMSRDFLITCADENDAKIAEQIILALKADSDETPLFEVDNRGRDLFVMLTYPRDITPAFVYAKENEKFDGFREDVAFVAIKNGQHNSVGYLLDTAMTADTVPRRLPLKDFPALICNALGLEKKTCRLP